MDVVRADAVGPTVAGNGELVPAIAQDSRGLKSIFGSDRYRRVFRPCGGSARLPPLWIRPRGGHVLSFLFCRPARVAPAPTGIGGLPMPAFVRAALAAALVLLFSVPTFAADKPFKR